MNLPPRWEDDPLSAFVGQSFRNALATFVHKSEAYGLLLRVDTAYLKIAENLVRPPNVLSALLLLRSHSAYRAGCRLALSGQASETFPLLRASLEYALYALHIHIDETLEEVWMRRHDDFDAMRQVKKKFQHVSVIATLRNCDNQLCPIIESLYERTIDFGAHPNERAVTGSMIMNEENGGVELQQIYLHSDSLSLDHVLKTTAQIGVGSLCIFQHIFRERFELLGIGDIIHELRQKL
jgi:hypothetical protein